MPPGTRSLVLIVDDPDAPDPKAPKMTWVHWVLYNLPPDTVGAVLRPIGIHWLSCTNRKRSIALQMSELSINLSKQDRRWASKWI